MQILSLLIFVFAMISSTTLIRRGIHSKEYGLYGTALPRIYLGLAALYNSFFPGVLSAEYFQLGVLIIFAADIFIGSVRLVAEKNKVTFYSKIKNHTEDLASKYISVIEGLPVGIFTIDLNGDLEYVNPNLKELLSLQEGNNLFSFLGVSKLDFIYNIKTKGGFVCPLGDKSFRIIASMTRNGHETITGSITKL